MACHVQATSKAGEQSVQALSLYSPYITAQALEQVTMPALCKLLIRGLDVLNSCGRGDATK